MRLQALRWAYVAVIVAYFADVLFVSFCSLKEAPVMLLLLILTIMNVVKYYQKTREVYNRQEAMLLL
jgi:uncharacterized membrane protein